MGNLYLIRHGQASFGADDYDVLSTVGERQSVALGEHLARLGLRLDRCVAGGSLNKFVGNRAVDGSLIHVATPYRLLDPGDPLMRATIARIESELRRDGGGVHRYADDSYYGGGEWLLHTTDAATVFTPEGLKKAIELNQILGSTLIVMASAGRDVKTLVPTSDTLCIRLGTAWKYARYGELVCAI